MGLKEQWAEARERNRQDREAVEARGRRYLKLEELRKLGVPLTGAGDLGSMAEDALDAMLAAERERQAELFDVFVRAGTVTTFRALGVQVLTGDDKVHTIGMHDQWQKTNSSRLLGPLAGAEARVTDSTPAFSPGKAMIMPVAAAPLARKETADALVTFPDGTTHSVKLDGSSALRDARKQCVEFNALARACSATPAETSNDPAARLQQLQGLLNAGLVSQDEYEAKRAEIIASI